MVKVPTYVNKWYAENKPKAINILGSMCAKCGDKNIHNLQFHHINRNRGKKHLEGTYALIQWIIDNPKEAKKDILVLCKWCH